MASEERREEATKDCVHRTKAIQFLGRTTPIILQNDNGPCPLLAICNVLLLKNNLNLSPDVAEVSQEKLLSLVAERLIDSNSNVNNKDAGYVENQQQNIADAIDLLPRLATGIDVNIKFRRIDDFEFTPECAIFDLLDIPLYHGWIVDPQDCGTTNVIGSKSYNAITGDLVALETRNVEGKCKNNPEEDSVDFAAATAATFGVPSPCLSRGRSFDESPRSVSDNQKERQGDMVDEADLLRALQLSEGDDPASLHDSCVDTNGGTTPVCLDESAYSKKSTSYDPVDTTEKHIGGEIESITLISLNESTYYKKSTPLDLTERHTGDENNSFCPPESSISDDCNTSINDQKDLTSFTTIPEEAVSSLLNTDEGYKINQSIPVDAGVSFPCNDVAENISVETLVQNDSGNHMSCSDVVEKASGGASVQNESAPSPCLESDLAFMADNHLTISGGDEQVEDQSTTCTSNIHENSDNKSCFDTAEVSSVLNADSDSPSGESKCVPEALTSSVDDSEPMYEGEECIMDSGKTNYEGREPMYEGEAVLAERSDKPSLDGHDASVKDEINEEQGELIRNFLNNNASQLTIYGLFCLQEGLKERELCVFFRNNHFSTMFKFDGELYLLATDQGYINQPDLVWEKLNEVNGDSLFMTGNFKEFKIESHENETWNEQNAMASTADYLASIDNPAASGSSFNSDHLLAMALQQEEFEQQPQRHAVPQAAPQSGSSRLVTGPQVNRNNGRNQGPPSKPESKSKEKCTVM